MYTYYLRLCIWQFPSRQYYSLLTTADLYECQEKLFTVCEAQFPLYHKRTPSCSGALYFGKSELAHENCNKVIIRKTFKPVWIHYKGTQSFWIYSLPVSMKVTKTCTANGTSTDIDLEGAGIVHIEENCQVFSESFLLLPTLNGYTNITLTPGQVVIPELPDLLTEKETQVTEGHHDQADKTLHALDALMTRDLATGQHEINLWDLLTDIRREQMTKHYYRWIIASVALILTIHLPYLTTKCWRRPLLQFAPRYVRRRTRMPAQVPVPRPRDVRTAVLFMVDEDCSMEEKSLMNPDQQTTLNKGPKSEVSTKAPEDPLTNATGETEGDRVTTTPEPLGVRYSQPGWYQP